MTIQQKIMLALDIAGLTQKELAERMGTSPAALNKRLKTGKFSDKDFNEIAAAFISQMEVRLNEKHYENT